MRGLARSRLDSSTRGYRIAAAAVVVDEGVTGAVAAPVVVVVVVAFAAWSWSGIGSSSVGVMGWTS